MACYVYWSQDDRKNWSWVRDQELNEILQEVRSKFNNEYYIREYAYETKRFLCKPKKEIRYELLVSAINQPDARIINFAQSHNWSINSMVHKSYILTYLFGLLSGYAYLKQNPISNH